MDLKPAICDLIYLFLSKMSGTKYNRIKIGLIERNKKNQDLANYMKVHISTVSDWCTNTNQPSIPDLFRIAKFLKMNVRDLLEPTIFESKLDDPVTNDNDIQKKTKKPNKK